MLLSKASFVPNGTCRGAGISLRPALFSKPISKNLQPGSSKLSLTQARKDFGGESNPLLPTRHLPVPVPHQPSSRLVAQAQGDASSAPESSPREPPFKWGADMKSECLS